MKKVIKSLSVLFLSLTIAVGSFVIASNTKADDKISNWKSNAILTPTAGSLVGAGYIDVIIDTSLEGYKYSVLLDGQQMFWKGNNIVKTELGEDTSGAVVKDLESNGSTTKTEVYTTTVSSHTLSVIAFKSGEQIFSDELTFYVSKKGLAMGDNMGDEVSLKKFNCSWYYNWGTKAFNNSIDDGVQHVPMMWGGADENKTEMANLSTTSNYILGFNEPDIDSQANMGFWDGVDVWNECIAPLSMRKVSPAPAAPGGDSDWLKDFMNGNEICQLEDGTWDYYSLYDDNPSIVSVQKDGVDWDSVDSVCLHYYRNTIDDTGIAKAIDRLWNTYHKPIWITEISLFGVKGYSTDMSYELEEKRVAIQNYLKSIVSKMESRPYVERYCWFPYDVDSTNDIDIYNGSGATAMFEYATGKYTELGRIYSQLGNPAGYSAQTISDGEMFKWEERITKPSETTTAASTTEPKTEPITNAPTTKKKTTPVKPGKATLSKVKNVKKKSAKVTWNKVAGATKYKAQCAMNKKFTKKIVTKYISSTTFKFSKLKKKKTYYFRVAAVNSAGTGAWSNIKKVKIKK